MRIMAPHVVFVVMGVRLAVTRVELDQSANSALIHPLVQARRQTAQGNVEFIRVWRLHREESPVCIGIL